MLPQNFKEIADSTSVWLELGTFPMPVELGMYGHPFYWIWSLPYFPFFIHYFPPHVSPAFCPEAASLWTCRFSPFSSLHQKTLKKRNVRMTIPTTERLVWYLGCFLNLFAIAERQIEVSYWQPSSWMVGRCVCVCLEISFFFKEHLPHIDLFLQWK